MAGWSDQVESLGSRSDNVIDRLEGLEEELVCGLLKQDEIHLLMLRD
jgi:hypothetical protein